LGNNTFWLFILFIIHYFSFSAYTSRSILGALFGIEYPPYSRTDNLILIINGILHFNDYIFLIALSLFTLAYLILIKNSRLKGSSYAKLSFLFLFIFVIFYFIGFIVKKSIAATVTYPVGGEVFIAGETITITWSLDGAHHIELSYKTSGADCGTNDGGWCTVPPGYTCIEHPVYGNSSSWTVPDVSTTTARIRVEGHTPTHGASGPASWTNPDDEDFKYVIIYKNGTFLANVTSPPYNFTGLSPGTTYQIATLTVDFAGNINTTWVNASDTTLSSGGGPNIIITSPSAGVIWLAGSTQTISRTSVGVNHFEISCTTDPNAPCQGEPIGTFGGPCSTGSWICIQPHPYTSTSYAWVVPNISSNSVRIRIEGHDSNHMVVTNACSGIFTISNQTTGGPTGGGTTGGAPAIGGTAGTVTNQTIINQTTANQTTKIQTNVTEIKGIIYVGVDLIEPEKPKTISIGKYNIKDISIKVRNRLTNVEIKVQPLGTKPSGIPEVKGVAYTYINISSANLKKEDLDSLAIRFSVNKTWISENDINVSTIKMLHYKNNSWEELQTELRGEDNLTVTFESYIKELSIFAIAGEKITKVTPIVEEKIQEVKRYDFIILVVSAIVISIVVGVFLIYRRKYV
jgi:PGF-pre-PGF domain-containing protein